LFTGKLNGCVPVVFVTLIIIRIINMLCHVIYPLFFGYRFHSYILSKLQFRPFSNPRLPRQFVRCGQTDGEKIKIFQWKLDRRPGWGLTVDDIMF
jgi:hypothetical protein